MQVVTVEAVAFLILVAVPTTVPAYCKKGHPELTQELRGSRLVFVGKVSSATDWSHAGGSTDGTLYSMEVIEGFKGEPPPVVTLYSENSSGRFPMDVGSSYVVFAHEDVFEFRASPELAIDNCGNSGSLQEPRARAVLERVRKLTHHSRRRQSKETRD